MVKEQALLEENLRVLRSYINKLRMFDKSIANRALDRVVYLSKEIGKSDV